MRWAALGKGLWVLHFLLNAALDKVHNLKGRVWSVSPFVELSRGLRVPFSLLLWIFNPAFPQLQGEGESPLWARPGAALLQILQDWFGFAWAEESTEMFNSPDHCIRSHYRLLLFPSPALKENSQGWQGWERLCSLAKLRNCPAGRWGGLSSFWGLWGEKGHWHHNHLPWIKKKNQTHPDIAALQNNSCHKNVSMVLFLLSLAHPVDLLQVWFIPSDPKWKIL